MELIKGTEETVEAEFGRPRFIPKKGSVFPRKRRSVKMMVFYSILKSIATHLCCLSHHPKIPAENYAKNVKIFPHQGR
ncbi:hypothetical protein I3843_16G023500 [Carya illinoinensis]|uniref:Uncharacterized protein n=1 Tax=Carya illinoinensis TaxID=32201 RepID=A0A922D8A5_CARIL|nr:hypothetical protein I3842_16G020600 [Carya illinoinensis]KAG7941130.1 hypothetical protein I3843_16G023500 [Carya illinoinensis]